MNYLLFLASEPDWLSRIRRGIKTGVIQREQRREYEHQPGMPLSGLQTTEGMVQMVAARLRHKVIRDLLVATPVRQACAVELVPAVLFPRVSLRRHHIASRNGHSHGRSASWAGRGPAYA
jgi:hypothetical protein